MQLASGQTLKFRKGKGYYAAGAAAPVSPYPGYLSPEEQRRQATALVDNALRPSITATQRQQTKAAQDARNQAAAIQGAYNALAALQSQAPGQIAQTYGQASERQAAFGKGYSDALQQQQNQTNDQSNALIAQNGGNALGTPGTGAADALYANGGYGPASQLNNAGAAFTTAAQGLSTQAMGLGAQGATSALFKGAETQKELSQQLMDLLAKKPQLLDEALRSLRGEQQQNYANFIQANYLANATRTTSANLTGVDPVTGLPTPDTVTKGLTLKQRQAAARAKAVTKRNDATVSSLVNGRDWVEKQLKPGYVPQHVADVPIKVGMTSPVKDSKGHIIVSAKPIYAKKGGGTTHDINEAATKAVYSQQPIPKPQYQKLLRQLTGRLTTELRRYGYKPAQIRSFAADLLDDYFTPQQIHPDTRPKRTTPHDPSVTDPLTGKVG